MAMIRNLLIILELVLSGLPRTFAGHAVDNPTAANFLRRAWHASVVLGRYVYIDGGEVSQLVDGVVDRGQGASANDSYIPGARQNNVTLSIDLETSWTNSSLNIQSVFKGSATLLDREDIWVTADGSSGYVWGGYRSDLAAHDGIPLPPVGLWKFSADGVGGGIWYNESLDSFDALPDHPLLMRPAGGCSTTIGDVGYYIGGLIQGNTDPNWASLGGGYFYENTITSFNSSSGVWDGQAPASINSEGTTIGSIALTIPAFGLDERGLIFVVGGRDPGTSIGIDSKQYNYTGFDNVTFYDPYIDRWYAQTATGDVPEPRESFCAVAVKGDNATYEIFIYGGIIETTWHVYDDVYVLSIPGFRWFKSQNTAASARYLHTCEFVGGSQFMSIGGLDNPQGNQHVWDIWDNMKTPDPFSQGIGIFDMTAMEWKSSYDANDRDYISPADVKDWYSLGNQDSVKWQSLELARYFIRDTAVTVDPTPVATTTAASSTATPESTATSKGNNSNSNAIELGVGIPSAVFGAFAAAKYWKRVKKFALAIWRYSRVKEFALAIWRYRRGKKSKSQTPSTSTEGEGGNNTANEDVSQHAQVQPSIPLTDLPHAPSQPPETTPGVRRISV